MTSDSTRTRRLPALAIAAALSVVPAACADEPGGKASADAGAGDAVRRYDGPPITAVLDGETLQLSVEVRSGGWQLLENQVQSTADGVDVLVTLIEPGPDEITTDVVETHRLELAVGDSGDCRVRVRHHHRGASPVPGVDAPVAVTVSR